MGESASLLLFHNLIYLMIILHLSAVVNRENQFFVKTDKKAQKQLVSFCYGRSAELFLSLYPDTFRLARFLSSPLLYKIRYLPYNIGYVNFSIPFITCKFDMIWIYRSIDERIFQLVYTDVMYVDNTESINLSEPSVST